ncbi:MAG: metalloprotease PmbA [Gammaproteobacteria bacterium]|nr:MAG: metalloprotease PmbA [Gammaproteobacteria bacterium]
MADPARFHLAPAWNSASLATIIEDALKAARAQGAGAAEAAVSADSGLSVTVRMGEVETVEHQRDKGLSVTVYFGRRQGSASSTDFSAKAIQDTVRAACNIARFTAEDECAGLADAERMAREAPDLDLHYPWPLSAEQAIALAREAEDAGMACDKRITNSEGASVASHDGVHAYGNTHGFLGSYASSRHSVSCTLIGQEGDSLQRDYWYSVARDPRDLEAPVAIGRRAARRTVRRLHARRLSTRTAPVLFEAQAATGLLGHLVGAVRGASLYRKASFLLDHLGKQIFPAFVHLHEQPHLKKALGSAPFDNEGVATRARDLVTGGVLQGYVLDSYSARKLGMQTTGNAGGVHNLCMDPGQHDLPGLLRLMDTGLLVTELLGYGVNIVTGDYSRGAAGFWVERGEIQYPVEEITIAGNLRDMFLRLSAAGADIETRGNIRTGSILIESMTIAGE